MSDIVTLKQLPHREAERIHEIIKRVETQVILCENSIRLHSIPEMQNIGDALEDLFQPLYSAAQRAKALEQVLYQDFIATDSKTSLVFKVVDEGVCSECA